MADSGEPSTSAVDLPSEQVENSPMNPFIEVGGPVSLARLQRALAEARLFDANPDALRQLFQLGGGDTNGVVASVDPFGSGGSASRTGPNPSLRDLLNGDGDRMANVLSTLRDGAVPSAPPRSDDTAAPSTSFQSVAPTVYPHDRPIRGLLGSRLSELPRFHGNPSEDKMSFGEWVEMYERLTRADRWSNEA